MKFFAPFLLSFLLFAFISAPENVIAAGECGKEYSPNRMALRLVPCMTPAENPQAVPSDRCCAQVHTLAQNPACLCALVLSNVAKSYGVKPEVAITIPKRCNLADRPIGYQCGAYTLP